MKIDFDEEEQIELPIVPMIDCAFLLLIFFLVATTFKDMSREIELDLPGTVPTADKKSDASLTIAIDRKGTRYLNGERISTAQLIDRIRKAAANDPSQRVRIEADRRVTYDDVVEIIDMCQFEGLEVFALRVSQTFGGK